LHRKRYVLRMKGNKMVRLGKVGRGLTKARTRSLIKLAGKMGAHWALMGSRA
jgi:hypothetical protein